MLDILNTRELADLIENKSGYRRYLKLTPVERHFWKLKPWESRFFENWNIVAALLENNYARFCKGKWPVSVEMTVFYGNSVLAFTKN